MKSRRLIATPKLGNARNLALTRAMQKFAISDMEDTINLRPEQSNPADVADGSFASAPLLGCYRFAL